MSFFSAIYIIFACMNIKPFYLESSERIQDIKNWYSLQTAYPENVQHPEDSTLFSIGFIGKDTVCMIIKAYQKEKISATILKDDQEDILNDDWILLVLDTEGKNNTAYAFQVNPIGTKRDFILSEGGDKVIEWDGDWKVKTGKSEWGYYMYFYIPLSTLSFSRNNKWGLRLERWIANRGELQVLCNTGSFQSLTGIATLDIDFSKIGEALTQAQQNMKILPSFYIRAFKQKDFDGSTSYSLLYGGNIRLKYKNSSLIDIFIKPDFSDIEADIEEIPINRKRIFYPEKRPFFMEGRALLVTPVNLIWTRAFENIKGGMKFYNKSRKLSSIFYVLNDETYDTISFGKLNFVPVKGYEFGLQYIFSPLSYKFVTFDSYMPVSHKYHMGVKLQATRRIDSVSHLFYGEFYRRSEFVGLDAHISYTHIDKNFLTPFSTLYFDDINEANISLAYGKNIKGNIVLKPQIYYFVDKCAENDTTVDEYISASMLLNKDKLELSLLLQKENMPYIGMDIEDKSYTYYGAYFSYTQSSYKSLGFSFLKGKYLGFDSYVASLKLKLNPLNRVNLGLKIDKIGFSNTNFLPNETLYQVFGILSLLGSHLIIKPYLGYHKTGERSSLYAKEISYINLLDSPVIRLYNVFTYEKNKDNDSGSILTRSGFTLKLVYAF